MGKVEIESEFDKFDIYNESLAYRINFVWFVQCYIAFYIFFKIKWKIDIQIFENIVFKFYRNAFTLKTILTYECMNYYSECLYFGMIKIYNFYGKFQFCTTRWSLRIISCLLQIVNYTAISALQYIKSTFKFYIIKFIYSAHHTVNF